MRALPAILLLVAAVSGAAGLGHQLTWTRRFALGLGHELPAALALVSAFFGGLALGSWVPGRRLHQSDQPLRWAAGLEGVTGLWALATLSGVPWLNQLARATLGAEPGPVRQWTIAFALPLLGLLPATTALGAALPALQRALTQAGRERWVPHLYATSTLGAALGVGLTLGGMHRSWGFTRTTLAWALVNLAAAIGLGVLAVVASPGSAPASQSGVPSARAGRQTDWRSVTLWFGTGLLGVGFEVLAIRLLQLVLPGTVVSFGVTLAVWLVGTALGAAVLALGDRRRVGHRHGDSPGWLPTLTAGGLVAGLAGLVSARGFIQSGLTRAVQGGHSGWGMETLAVALLVVPATLPMAMLFSRLAQQAAHGGAGLGVALAWNTLGSALAAPVLGALLIPAAGTRTAGFTLVLGYLGLQMLVPECPRKWAAVAGALFLLAVPRTLDLVQAPPGARLVEIREGATDTVAVLAFADGNRSLAVNNRFVMGGTGATNAAARHGHLPLLLHPAPRRALFLGVGTGISLASASAYPDLEVEGVELVPEVVAMERHFAPHNTLPSRGRIVVADARRYLLSTSRSYDVVVADLFHPDRDGAAALYTREHFAAMKARLRPGGLACQWLPLYQLNPPALEAILKAWLAEFPETALWWLRWNLDTPVMGLIGSREPLQFRPGWYQDRIAGGVRSEPLRAAGLTDDFQLFGGWVGYPTLPDAAGTMNTDDHPIVAWASLEWSGSDWNLDALLDWAEAVARRSPPFPADSADWARELGAFRQARDAHLRGLEAEAAGQRAAAESLMFRSLQLSRHFPTSYSWLVSRALSQAGPAPAEARRLLERLARERPDLPLATDLLRRLTPGPGRDLRPE